MEKKVNVPIHHHRVFLAIPIEQDLRNYIYQTIKSLYHNHPSLRWINEENYHVTLHYLGSISEAQLISVTEKMSPVIANYSSFSLKLELASAFPSSHKPHSLVLLVKLSFLLNSLYEETKNIISSCGIELPTRPYTPHLTVGRIKVGGWVGGHKRLPTPLKIGVQKLNLLQSLQDDYQVRFRELATFELNHYKVEA